jgi:hypothetical protein
MPLPRPFQANPGNLWRPGFKPSPAHTAEYSPHGSLSKSLGALVLFEHCNRPGFLDYVQPGNKISFAGAGTSQAATVSPYGGTAFSVSGLDTNFDGLTYATSFPTTAIWSFSMLIKFDGGSAGPLFEPPALVQDSGRTIGINVVGSGADFFEWSDSSASFVAPVISNFTTWTRLTFVADGTNNVTVYTNGTSPNSMTVAGGTSIAADYLAASWPWPIADFFWWNRALSAPEAMAHSVDPYGTTMRPKMDEWTIKGTAAVGSVKKQGLLTTGVGP